MTESIDGDKEDRASPTAKAITLAESVFKNVQYEDWVKYKTSFPYDPLMGEVARVNNILKQEGMTKRKLFNVIATGKRIPEFKVAAENLENGLMTKWIKSSIVQS